MPQHSQCIKLLVYKKWQLIKCPECKSEISSNSNVCIKCGYPIEKSEKVYRNASELICSTTDIRKLKTAENLLKSIQPPYRDSNENLSTCLSLMTCWWLTSEQLAAQMKTWLQIK